MTHMSETISTNANTGISTAHPSYDTTQVDSTSNLRMEETLARNIPTVVTLVKISTMTERKFTNVDTTSDTPSASKSYSTTHMDSATDSQKEITSSEAMVYWLYSA